VHTAQGITLVCDSNCGYYYWGEEITGLVMVNGNEAIAGRAELEVFKLKVA